VLLSTPTPGTHLLVWQNPESMEDKDLDEFIKIYKGEFGKDISRKEASEMTHRLLTLYESLARKLPNEHKAPNPTQHDDRHQDDHRRA
jgi:hypothetical protein